MPDLASAPNGYNSKGVNCDQVDRNRHSIATVDRFVKFIGHDLWLSGALHAWQLCLMDRIPFHLALPAATDATQSGMAVPDEFHEAMLLITYLSCTKKIGQRPKTIVKRNSLRVHLMVLLHDSFKFELSHAERARILAALNIRSKLCLEICLNKQ